jgi:hypothetical protein
MIFPQILLTIIYHENLRNFDGTCPLLRPIMARASGELSACPFETWDLVISLFVLSRNQRLLNTGKSIDSE